MKFPKWCKHIVWYVDISYIILSGGFVHNDGTYSWIDDDWKYCPLCGKKRPK